MDLQPRLSRPLTRPTPAPTPAQQRRARSARSGPPSHEGADQHGDEAEQLADRKIDQAAGDDEGLAEREQRQRRRLVDDVPEVFGGHELRAGHRARNRSGEPRPGRFRRASRDRAIGPMPRPSSPSTSAFH